MSFRDLHAAWRAARRGKKPSVDQIAFDAQWMDRLLELQERLNTLTWSPSPCTCFIASQPKAREIHAPAFPDRVVHHYLVPRLEAIYEPRFVHDSYSNRRGKGTHAAVDRLQAFVRQVQSGQSGGWYLQLDIRNCFNRIHRPTLYRMLKREMGRHDLPLPIRKATHALLARSCAETGVRYACTPEQRAAVPLHKRLEGAPPGCGIAIGNLSSQFFANVYLDALDQFVKHELKTTRYLRYVDDFVLVHSDRDQLVAWRERIERFLANELRLELKPSPPLRRLTEGIDFLGYVVFPTHRLVRRRVIAHARAKLAAWEREHVRPSGLRASNAALEHLRSIWASYLGHFRRASSYRVRERIFQRFAWLPYSLVRTRCRSG
ncbi:MAG TPA: reverse transcriptase/maturase family protein [Dehalococcoidia bacterium]|nr:reverse transcriptase/maturase family protein [Dehalococcoidia bacterium]